MPAGLRAGGCLFYLFIQYSRAGYTYGEAPEDVDFEERMEEVKVYSNGNPDFFCNLLPEFNIYIGVFNVKKNRRIRIRKIRPDICPNIEYPLENSGLIDGIFVREIKIGSVM